MKKSKKDYETEILDIIKIKDWDRAKKTNDINLYQYIRHNKDTDKDCRAIWEHIKIETRDHKFEISKIVETKNWDRAKKSNDLSLYLYIRYHKDTDESCKIIWEHIKTETRDLKSEILEIVETKDWDRAKGSNDKSIYTYIYCHKDIDESCRTIWNHIREDRKSEILDIIKTKDWDRAKGSNDRNLYSYIHRRKDTDENCKIVWEHIMVKKHYPYTIKDYLLDYFKHGKLENRSLYNWFRWEIEKGNQSCIDVKNLIVASKNYKDPIAIETLELIKNHLEKEGT